MTTLFGWRSIFAFVALAALLLAMLFRRNAGETLPAGRRRTARPATVVRTYKGLMLDRRFIRPALAVSLIIGCLYSFFGAASAILAGDMGFSPAELSLFFAATVLVVFASGLLTAPLARRLGGPRVGFGGVLIALAGSVWLVALGSSPQPAGFIAALTLFLAGMGLINPIGSAITLHPFGDRAGAASALLGFLQMGLAAIGTALVGALPGSTAQTFALVMLLGTAGAAVMFAPVAMNRRHTVD
jgi:DHA1 family bicyclomycin/chloramphenicol resistance-like MFS transporter